MTSSASTFPFSLLLPSSLAGAKSNFLATPSDFCEDFGVVLGWREEGDCERRRVDGVRGEGDDGEGDPDDGFGDFEARGVRRGEEGDRDRWCDDGVCCGDKGRLECVGDNEATGDTLWLG